LTALSGLSSTETFFKFVIDILKVDAAQMKPVPVHTIAHFVQGTGSLPFLMVGPAYAVESATAIGCVGFTETMVGSS
jgi:hypothetical protein